MIPNINLDLPFSMVIQTMILTENCFKRFKKVFAALKYMKETGRFTQFNIWLTRLVLEIGQNFIVNRLFCKTD